MAYSIRDDSRRDTAPQLGRRLAPALRSLPVGTWTALALGAGLVVAGGWSARILVDSSPFALLVSLALYFIAALTVAAQLSTFHPHRVFGVANTVTLLRAAVICVLAGIAAPMSGAPESLSPEIIWGLLAVALATLMLDGFDGWAARRQGLMSAFGARFDMEVDSAFAVVLAGLVLRTGDVGAWVLFVAVGRYLFLAAQAIWPWMRRALPESFRRKSVCVLQIGTLCVLLAPPVQGVAATALGFVALAALIWSFMVDIRWLMQMRTRPV